MAKTKQAKEWILTNGYQQVKFTEYTDKYMVLSSPTAPCTVEGIHFLDNESKIVLTKDNGREMWDNLRKSNWNPVPEA